MSFFIYLKSADFSSNLGRLDYASLSQQALMEMVVDGITNREKITGSKEDPKDVLEWAGVHLDEKRDVIGILWISFHLEGALSLEWLPPKVQFVTIRLNDLSGTINWAKLPSSLIMFRIGWNKLNGEVDFVHLPANMQHLNLEYNTFAGSMNLEKLPENLKRFSAGTNACTGTINITHLPDGLLELDVGSNHLSGSIDLTSLPETLHVLSLHKNALCGTIDLRSLPYDLEELLLYGNRFSGETDFSTLPQSLQQFDVSDNVDLTGDIEIDADEDFLNIHRLDVTNTQIYGNIWANEEKQDNFLVEKSKVKIILTE